MNWGKAGRPKKGATKSTGVLPGAITIKQETVETKEKKWSRLELQVNKNGLEALAMAVLRQWKKDGCPKTELDGVLVWAELLKEHLKKENAKI